MISEKTIEAIKSKLSITDLISETVDLKGRGNSFVGLCPFHSEKSPSFHVRASDGYYHCFGCGASGNLFTFVMATRNFTFPEAIEYLADKLGIEVEETKTSIKKKDNRRDLYQVNSAALEFYHNNLKINLKKTPKIFEYLKHRQLTSNTINNFKLGLANNEWRNLSDYLISKGFKESLLLEAGLVKRSQKGELYDTFRARLIFPVFIDDQRVAGFGGRIIPGFTEQSDAPKYLNSSETSIYEKSKILYGLPQALKTIKANKKVFIVEGYLDVTSMHQAKIENVLAVCGTALTKQHLQRLATLANKVFLLFDGDSAGRAAASKAFVNCLNSGINLSAIFLPEGLDPDDFAKKYSDATLEKLSELDNKSLLSAYIDQSLINLGIESLSKLEAASKAKLVDLLMKQINQVENQVEKAELIKQVAFLLKLDRNLIAPDISNKSNKKEVLSSHNKNTKLSALEHELLRSIISAPKKFAPILLEDQELCSVCSSSSLEFISNLFEIYSSEDPEIEKKQRVLDLLKSKGSQWIKLWKESFAMQEDPLVDFEKVFLDCRLAARKRKITMMIGQIESELLNSPDQDDLASLYQRKLELNRKLQQL